MLPICAQKFSQKFFSCLWTCLIQSFLTLYWDKTPVSGNKAVVSHEGGTYMYVTGQILIQVEIFSPTIGDKIVEALYSIRVQRVTIESKRIHTPPPPLHSKLWCLLFSIGSLGRKALFSPLEVSKESESSFRAVSWLILWPIVQL